MRFGLLLILLSFTSTASAQTNAPIDPAHVDSTNRGYKRSPLLAAGLSYIVPGGGHLYNGEFGKAGRFAAGELGAYALMLTGALIDLGNRPVALFCIADDYEDCRRGEIEPLPAALLAIGAVGFVYIKGWSMVDSYRSARRINQGIDQRRAQLGAIRVEATPTLVAGQLGASVRVQW